MYFVVEAPLLKKERLVSCSPVTWRAIIKVIQGPLVENNNLANKIFQSLKEKKCNQKTINSKYIQCIL